MNKKGQGISVNVIIIAALALAVLVVMFATFTGRIGLFSKGVSDTEKSLSCKQKCEISGYTEGYKKVTSVGDKDCKTGDFKIFGTFVDYNPEDICCCKS